jgi:glutathione-specific gamma-glutamylcyclotransferase
MMWVFGYGSLMWDGWEETLGCVGRRLADLGGYRRVFNKASVRNWGTKKSPCPTLNLKKEKASFCRGMAFEFADDRMVEIEQYLAKREGQGFSFPRLPIHVDGRGDVLALGHRFSLGRTSTALGCCTRRCWPARATT